MKKHLCVLTLVTLMICGSWAGFASADINPGDAKETIDRQQEGSELSPEDITIPPVAAFQASRTSGVVPLTVDFRNTSEHASSSRWDFGDGSRSTEESPSHTYKKVGSYTVTLTVKNGELSDTKSAGITVKRVPPTAEFSAAPRSGSVPLKVVFSNDSEHATSFEWNFGDGAKSTDVNPTHTYKKVGSYSVTLTAGNGDTSKTRIRKSYISVVEVLPKADFKATPQSGNAPLTVSFTNTSSNATSFLWDFGDGRKSKAENPIHGYKQPGNYTVKLTAKYKGKADTSIKTGYITVKQAPPKAGFKASPLSGTGSLLVTFTNTSTNATSFLWDFGDGTSSREMNPTHDYKKTGSFTVSLTAFRGAENDTWTEKNYITVNPFPPQAAFEGAPRSGSIPLIVSFKNNSSHATSYEWDFGDGSTSTEENPVHQYSQVGTYSVKLKAINGSLTNTKVEPGYINATPLPPTAAFMGSPQKGNCPLTVNFINTSLNATEFLWDFGDGSSSQEKNPSHTYSGVGSFAVSLTASNGQTTHTKTVQGYITTSELILPKAEFEATPLSGVRPLTVSFRNSSTDATSFSWDFGDGATSTQEHPVHQYTTSGTFTVKLTAGRDDLSDTRSRPGYITVTEPVVPHASFQATPRSGPEPLTVNFINTSSNAESYIWDFGDGKSSQATNPSHEYSESGSYTVTLIAIKENLTDTATEPNYITVAAPPAPSAGFTAAPLTGPKPLTVTFTNTSTNGSSYQWDFGDGATSTDKDPVHQYSETGIYTVSLTAKNQDSSNTQTRAGYITVTEIPPQAAFSATPLSGTKPLSVNFLNTSSNATAYLWDFGDGASSTEPSPSHSYQKAGTYTVSLTAKNGNLTDTRTQADYIIVSDPISPKAGFTGTPLRGDPPLEVTFTNTSTNATSYQWSFGDGTTSTDLNPVHQFTSTGSFTVALTARNGSSTDTMTKADYVIVTSPGHELETEPNNDTAHADRLTSDVPMIGQISSSADLDYFYLNTDPMDIVPVVIQYKYYSSDEVCVRYHVSIYDSSSTLLAGMPIMPSEDEEIALSFNALAQSNYYIRVEPPLASDLPACTDLAAAHLSDPYTLTASFLSPALSPLGISSLSGPAECSPGETVSVVNRVENRGKEVSGPFSVRLYLAKTRKVDPAADHLLRQYSFQALEPGYTVKRTLILKIPAAVKPGTYYLGAIVDAPDILSQIDAINDSKALSPEIQVIE